MTTLSNRMSDVSFNHEAREDREDKSCIRFRGRAQSPDKPQQ
ncbi:hypothetical protein [Cerasicoccus fimbriatus]|nr:hypothetical protein [Cerasicoccus sp. TK19100]